LTPEEYFIYWRFTRSKQDIALLEKYEEFFNGEIQKNKNT
jgi:hypothetical protein